MIGEHDKEVDELTKQSDNLLNDIIHSKMQAQKAAGSQQQQQQVQQQQAAKVQEFQVLVRKTLSLSDTKVNYASEAYNMVDAIIKRLDADITRLHPLVRPTPQSEEDQRKLKRKRGRVPGGGAGQAPKGRKPGHGRPKKSRVHFDLPDSAEDGEGVEAGQQEAIHPSEPVYCICQRVSFGEMVACDNPDCQIEWFHFQCVGLTEKPEGKWYCPSCAVQQ